MRNRLPPLEAAKLISQERYPNAQLILLAGSVTRGEGTPTSDLDLVIVTTSSEAPYRESFIAHDWPVEAFIHTVESLEQFFKSDAARRRPSLANMCHEGLVVVDTGIVGQFKAKAKDYALAKPPKLTEKELEQYRYFITDALDDFIGAKSHEEALFVAAPMLGLLCDFIFDTRQQWRCVSKRNFRQLAKVNPELHNELLRGLEEFYKQEDKDGLIKVIDGVLEPSGGRLFAGYKVGGKPPA